MVDGFGILVEVGERLGLRAPVLGERDRLVGQLGTRDGREALMQEAVAGGSAGSSGVRHEILGTLRDFHGRNELFLEARIAATRAGRPFEDLAAGELNRYNTLESGRSVAPFSPSGPPPGSPRDTVLAGLATRDGRAAFLSEAREGSGATSAGPERGRLLDQARDPSGRSSLLAEAQIHAARQGRSFEPLGGREPWARSDPSVDRPSVALEIGGIAQRSPADVETLIRSIDRGLDLEPRAVTGRAAAGPERD